MISLAQQQLQHWTMVSLQGSMTFVSVLLSSLVICRCSSIKIQLTHKFESHYTDCTIINDNFHIWMDIT